MNVSLDQAVKPLPDSWQRPKDGVIVNSGSWRQARQDERARRNQPGKTDTCRREARFFRIIANGIAILDSTLATLNKSGTRVIDGDTDLKFRDTFACLLDFTADVFHKRGVKFGAAGFHNAMARQSSQIRASANFKVAARLDYSASDTAFHG